MTTKKVYEAIRNVSQALINQGGIEKNNPNAGKKQQYGAPDYAFRSIDQVYNALAPALTANGLVILPRMTNREVVERLSSNNKALFYVTVTAEFDFVSTEDSSHHTVITYGEAMDTGDKATNKAMSVAYKYAAFQVFCIPTEDMSNDSDFENHEVLPSEINQLESEPPQQKAKPILTPDKKEPWERAIASYKQHGNLELVKEHAIVSTENEKLIIAASKKTSKPF